MPWLDEEEMRAWRGLVEVYADVHAALTAELQEEFGFDEGDYGVLVNVSEAPDRGLRMSEHAERLHLAERPRPQARRPRAPRVGGPRAERGRPAGDPGRAHRRRRRHARRGRADARRRRPPPLPRPPEPRPGAPARQ